MIAVKLNRLKTIYQKTIIILILYFF